VPSPFCDPAALQAVKDALNQNDRNVGVGILHEPTGQIHLLPMDSLPNRGGHAELASVRGVSQAECKGFAVAKSSTETFFPVNLSQLNGPQGMPGSMQMPQALFDDVVQALRAAGL
jgi:hypothetical protein